MAVLLLRAGTISETVSLNSKAYLLVRPASPFLPLHFLSNHWESKGALQRQKVLFANFLRRKN